MKKMLQRCIVPVALVAAMALLAACGDKAEEPIAEPVVEEEPILCPLDGEELDSEDAVGGYLFVVAIDNGADAEPQAAIGDADLLLEVPAEAGINRLLAFFYHHTPANIGPVRSARHYFYDFINGFDAVMAHCGGSSQAYDVIHGTDVKDIDEMGETAAFERIKTRKAPHNLYTSYERLAEVATARGYEKKGLTDLPAFTFYDEDEVNALTFGGVDEMTLPYRYKAVRYVWSDSRNAYERYSKDELHLDENTGEPLIANNVITLYVSGSVIDSEARLDMEIVAGEGLLLQYGNVTDITWDMQEGRGLALYDATGENVKLIPGRTIVQVISPDQKAEYTPPAEAAGEEDAAADGGPEEGQ